MCSGLVLHNQQQWRVKREKRSWRKERTHTHTHTCSHTCTHIHMWMHTFIYTYTTYTQTHTYTNTTYTTPMCYATPYTKIHNTNGFSSECCCPGNPGSSIVTGRQVHRVSWTWPDAECSVDTTLLISQKQQVGSCSHTLSTEEDAQKHKASTRWSSDSHPMGTFLPGSFILTFCGKLPSRD